MENRNTIIALVLMLALWFGYSILFPPQPPPPAPEQPRQEEPARETDKERAAPLMTETDSESHETPLEVPTSGIDTPERILVVDTDFFTAEFTSSGARLLSFRLKRYHETEDSESPRMSLIDVTSQRIGSLRLSGSDGFGLSTDLNYAVSTDEDTIRLVGDEQQEIIFRGFTPAGLSVEKVFAFSGNSYDFGLTVRIRNGGNSTTRGALVLSLVQPWDESMGGTQFEFVGPVTLAGEEVNTDDVEDVEESPVSYRDVVWTAFETKYFLSAAVPLEGAAERVVVEKKGELVLNHLETPTRTLEPQETTRYDYLLYYGPRDLDILEKVNHRLEEAIDFGFFSWLALPLRHVLTFFYGYVGNYGVAIILLTVIIKILFWPLTHKSYASMKGMQKLQPEMQKLREKYKNDRERMNRELMEMYKKHRVNPLGGCLPMLIQIPVFFALYKVLLGDIALRHAPFMLWISDLSAKDPYYVTPILMGATMFLQQKMTPTTMDPTQAKIFMIMPVVFTFLFLNFPAGLVIYWLTNNVLTIAQQMLINRKA